MYDDGWSPSVLKAFVTLTQRKNFFLFSVAIFFHGKDDDVASSEYSDAW